MFKWWDGRYISRLVVSEKVNGEKWEHYVHWKTGDCFFCKSSDKPCIMIHDNKRNIKTDHELGTYHTVCKDCIISSIPDLPTCGVHYPYPDPICKYCKLAGEK